MNPNSSSILPRILIVTEDGFDPNFGSANLVLSRAYSEAVSAAGGLPLTAMDIRCCAEYAALADGLLLTGGPVIHPARYGGIVTEFSDLAGYSSTRDDMDFALGRLFLEQGKPVLGVGRGAMVLNVLRGGTVQKKLPELPKIAEDALSGQLGALLGEQARFSRQYGWGIGSLGDGLQPAAVSPEGIVDAVADPEAAVLGVVWHPERELDGIPADNRLFGWLVKEAAK